MSDGTTQSAHRLLGMADELLADLGKQSQELDELAQMTREATLPSATADAQKTTEGVNATLSSHDDRPHAGE